MIRPDHRKSAVLVWEHERAIGIEPRPVIGRQIEIGQIVIAQIQVLKTRHPGAV